MSQPPVFLQQGFRPFFLLAGLLALTAVPLWVGSLAGLRTLPDN
ncbi:MAG: NnrS family protein, partial [Rhodospirillales bacterium]|nr:NnrS family protein [Rhodospirillales bacterium]